MRASQTRWSTSEGAVDTGQVNDWVAAIRPRSWCGSPGVYYLFSSDGTSATSNDEMLDTDSIFDIQIRQGNTDKYRYVSFLGVDGGAPCVSLHKN